MESENYIRTYRIRCGRQGEQGFEIGNADVPWDEALHVSFSVEKSDVESPNTAKVQIWNLSDESLRVLDGQDCVLELSAGYGFSTALVVVGNVTSVTTTPDNADRLTEIEVVDGRAELRDTFITISLNGTCSSERAYERVAESMGMALTFAPDLSFPSMPEGFCFAGKAKDALDKVSGYCGHSWTIQNHTLQVTWPGRAIGAQAFVLAPDSGLLGTPKKVTIGQEAQGEGTQTGWEVDYFLNAAIGVNDVVQLQCKEADGFYRVHKVTIDGDNMEGDWACSAQLLEIRAAPEGSGAGGQAAQGGAFQAGDKVRVIRTFEEGGRTKGYQYGGGTFVCWYPAYDVIQASGDRVVIGIGSTVTAAVAASDLERA